MALGGMWSQGFLAGWRNSSLVRARSSSHRRRHKAGITDWVCSQFGPVPISHGAELEDNDIYLYCRIPRGASSEFMAVEATDMPHEQTASPSWALAMVLGTIKLITMQSSRRKK